MSSEKEKTYEIRLSSRAATTAPPERIPVSTSFRVSILPSPDGCWFGLRILGFEVTYVFAFAAARKIAHRPSRRLCH